jgi:hypothetical protein
MGCTHYKIQKYIELELRRQALNAPKWERGLPTYDISKYRQNYFLNDYDHLMVKIFENRKYQEGNFIVS